MGEKADAESKRVTYKAVLIREQRAEVRRVMQSVGSLINRCDAVRYEGELDWHHERPLNTCAREAVDRIHIK